MRAAAPGLPSFAVAALAALGACGRDSAADAPAEPGPINEQAEKDA